MPRSKSEERPFLEIAKMRLVDIFAEAKNAGESLSAEMALSRMWEQLRSVLPNPSQVSESAKRATRRSLKSDVARLKELHHFAVDEFYKTYFPEESGPGRGRLPAEDRLEAKQMHENLQSWPRTAETLEPEPKPTVKHPADKFRKRAQLVSRPSKAQDVPTSE